MNSLSVHVSSIHTWTIILKISCFIYFWKIKATITILAIAVQPSYTTLPVGGVGDVDVSGDAVGVGVGGAVGGGGHSRIKSSIKVTSATWIQLELVLYLNLRVMNFWLIKRLLKHTRTRELQEVVDTEVLARNVPASSTNSSMTFEDIAHSGQLNITTWIVLNGEKRGKGASNSNSTSMWSFGVLSVSSPLAQSLLSRSVRTGIFPSKSKLLFSGVLHTSNEESRVALLQTPSTVDPFTDNVSEILVL